MSISVIIVLFIANLIMIVVSWRLSSKAIIRQKSSYRKLRNSLKNRQVLDTHTGPEHLRPQWEIRLAELEPWTNYRKILKHLRFNIEEGSFTAAELKYMEDIENANQYFVPAIILPVVVLLEILLLSL